MKPAKLQAYDVHYTDHAGNLRVWVTYGRDSFHVKCSAVECLSPGYRITKILPVPDFDW
jgi:hypothetical protein